MAEQKRKALEMKEAKEECGIIDGLRDLAREQAKEIADLNGRIGALKDDLTQSEQYGEDLAEALRLSLETVRLQVRTLEMIAERFGVEVG